MLPGSLFEGQYIIFYYSPFFMPLGILQVADTSSLSHLSFRLKCLVLSIKRLHKDTCHIFGHLYQLPLNLFSFYCIYFEDREQNYMQFSVVDVVWIVTMSTVFYHVSVTFLHFLFLIRVCSQLFHRLSQISVSCKSNIHSFCLIIQS